MNPMTYDGGVTLYIIIGVICIISIAYVIISLRKKK